MTAALDLIAKLFVFALKEGKVADPVPMALEAIDELERSLGCALPPSLRAWLAFDTGYVKRNLGWFEGARAISTQPLVDLVRNHSGLLAEELVPLVEARLPGGAVALEGGSDSIRFLWLGDPDAEAEYPVLFLDHDTSAVLGVRFPSFAVWLANELGIWQEGVAYNKYKAPRQEVSARILGKKGDVEPGGTVPKKLSTFVPPPPPGANAAFVLPRPASTKAKKLTDVALVKAIEQAAERRDTERARTLIADLVGRKLDGARLLGAALLRAATARDPEVVTLLLAAGASANTHSPTYGSVLALASHPSWSSDEEEALRTMRALLGAGADPDGARQGARPEPDAHADETSDHLPLHEAGQSGRVRLVRLLLEAGADPNAAPKIAPRGRVPLLSLLAGEVDSPEILTALIDAGARVDTPGIDGPLHRAARLGYAGNADALLDAGADLNALDARGDTALHLAFGAGELRLARRLVARGARRDLPGSARLTMDQVFDAEGRDVRPLEVTFFAAEAPQTLRLVLELLGARQEGQGVNAVKFTTAVPEILLLSPAGGRYAPGAATGTADRAELVVEHDATEVGRTVTRGLATLESPPLDPHVLALAVRVLLAPRRASRRGDEVGLQAISLSIKGSATSGTPVDAAELRAWSLDPALRVGPKETPFPLTVLEGRGAITVETVGALDDPARVMIEKALSAYADLASYLPRSNGELFESDGRAFPFHVRPSGKARSKAAFLFGRILGAELDPERLDLAKDPAVDALRSVLSSLHARLPLAQASLTLPPAGGADASERP